MKPGRWQRIEQLYYAALERDAAERASFLKEACEDDAALRKEIESLLAANERADGFLDTPALEVEAKNLARSPSASLGLHIGEVMGNYKILSRLGAGGMGVVWRARDMRLDREVAIKVLPALLSNNSDSLRRFEQEARATSALNHPNILTIYDIGEHEGAPFIVAEMLEGRELLGLLNDGPLPIRRSVDFALQITRGLEAAHEKGIIHRDLKPANLFVTKTGHVKILDFGIAKLKLQKSATDADPEASTRIALTNPGMILGTVGYMSPEQVRGRYTDNRSDIFSFGVILYEMLTGQRAFGGDSAVEVMSAILKEEPTEIIEINSKVPPQLERIVRRCLEKQPENRFQTASDLSFALEALYTPSGSQLDIAEAPSARKPSAWAKQLSSRRLRFIIPALLAVLLLAFLLSKWSPFQPQQSLPQPSAKAVPYYKIGIQALRDGSYYKASDYLKTAIEIDPQFSLAHARLSEALAEQDYSVESNKELLIVSSQVSDRSRLPAFDRLTLEAIQNTAVRNLPAAIANYKELIELAPESEKPGVYIDLGRAYEKSDEPDNAIENYSRALESDPQLPTAHLRLGVIYGHRQKDMDKANEAFKRAEELYQGNKEGLAELFFNRGMMYDGLNRLDEAREQLKRVTQIGSDYQKIKAILQLSGNSHSAGKLDQAQQEAEEGLGLAQKNDMKSLTTQGYTFLASVYYARGDYDKAIDYYNQAIASARVYSGRKDTAYAQVNLGSLLIMQGRLDEGVHKAEAAQRFFNAAGYRSDELQSVIIITRAKRKQGDYEAARAGYEQQLLLAEQLSDQALVAQVHSEISLLLIAQERYTEASPHIDESYRINQSMNLKPKVANALTTHALVRSQLGDYQTARAALGEAALIANPAAGSDKQLLAQITLLEARMALSEQDFNLAIQKSQQAVRQSGAQWAEIEISALHMQGLAEALSGSARQGLQHCQEAVTRAEEQQDVLLLADAKLALAQSKAITGEWQESLNLARQAQELFSRPDRIESEWRAWLVVARAYQSLKQSAASRDAALKASEKIDQLQQRWGAAPYADYVTRADIKSQYAQLRDLLSQ